MQLTLFHFHGLQYLLQVITKSYLFFSFYLSKLSSLFFCYLDYFMLKMLPQCGWRKKKYPLWKLKVKAKPKNKSPWQLIRLLVFYFMFYMVFLGSRKFQQFFNCWAWAIVAGLGFYFINKSYLVYESLCMSFDSIQLGFFLLFKESPSSIISISKCVIVLIEGGVNQ